MTKLSLTDSSPRVEQAVANAERARGAGLHRFWMPQVRSADPLTTLAVVAREVPTVGLGTAVVAMQTMMPQTLAQACRTLNQISDGRFTLGLGVSHEPAMVGLYGIPWNKPYSHLVEYLDALLPLLSEQKVSTSGEFVTHHTEIDVPGPNPEVVLAALGTKMLRLAGARTSGTNLWMTGPNTIKEHIRPNLGPAGQIIAGVPVMITDDVAGARVEANKELAIYGMLPSYRAVLDREGYDEPADMVLMGDADTIRAGLERYRDAGATEVTLSIQGPRESREAMWDLIATTGGEL